MRLSWELAWRYLRRHPQRGRLAFTTLVSVSGVALGVGALIVVMSILSGLGGFISESVLSAEAPLVITHRQAGGFFEASPELTDELRSCDGVAAVSPYVEGEAIIRHPHSGREAGCRLRGVEIAMERSASAPWMDRMVYGDPVLSMEDGFPGMVAGLYLAEQLAHPQWDTLFVFPPAAFFSARGFFIGRVVLTGSMETGLPANDKVLAIVPLSLAQSLMRSGSGVTGISVWPGSGADARRVASGLRELIPDSLEVSTWQERNPSLASSLQLERLASFSAILLITLVASFNILGTISRSVVERRKDIAILKAMGADRRLIMRVFLWEGFLVGATGVVIGLLLGLAGCFVLASTSIITLPDVYSFHEHLPVRVVARDVAIVALAALFLSVASASVPASRAARLDPVKGLQG